jgi:hypothetical protein
MPLRLGELLVAARLLDQSQVERALRAQVVWGGRLGTNLIELGMLDLEAITRARGRKHKMPAALARHFERADRELQERLSTEIAQRWSAVPLLHVGPNKQQIAIAALDPLPREARLALAEELLCPPEAIVVSVAAEMRVRYHLERVYGIARPPRFLRSRNKSTQTPFPQFENVPVPIDSDAEVAVPIAVDDSAHPTGRAGQAEEAPPTIASPAAMSATMPALPAIAPADDPDDIARLIDEAIEQVTVADEEEPPGRDRRTYVRTVVETDREFPPLKRPPAAAALGNAATVLATPTPPPAEPVDPPTLHRQLDGPTLHQVDGPTLHHEPLTQPLARVAIKRVAATAPTEDLGPQTAGTFLEATRSIRRANNRDRVAERVIDALQRFVPVAEAAVLLFVRGDVAISWASFSRVGTPSADIVVPLEQPGLLPRVIDKNTNARASASELGPIDAALLRSLGDLHGDLVIVPIAVADTVMGMIATATEADAAIEAVESIAAAAASAVARLIRDASR